MFLSTWQRWDALWYQKIALEGYGPENTTTNFYPLYPLLSRLVLYLVGGHIVWAELIVSSTCFVLAMRLLYEIAARKTTSLGTDSALAATSSGSQRERGAGPTRRRAHFTAISAPTLTVLLVALFPTGFFLLAPFTESLFLTLTLATFWLAGRQRWWLAGASGFLSALARANGAALVFPLVWEYLRRQRIETQNAGVPPTAARFAVRLPKGWLRPGWALLAAVLPLAGAVAWSAYTRLIVGVTERSTIPERALKLLGAYLFPGEAGAAPLERGLGTTYRIVPPWEAIAASVAHMVEGVEYLAGTRLGEEPRSLLGVEVLDLVSLLGFCALAVLVARRLPFMYSLYLWPNLAVLLTRTMVFSPLLSTGRYVLVLFPCFVVLAVLLAPRPRIAVPWLAASAVSQLVLLHYFVQWRFVA